MLPCAPACLAIQSGSTFVPSHFRWQLASLTRIQISTNSMCGSHVPCYLCISWYVLGATVFLSGLHQRGSISETRVIRLVGTVECCQLSFSCGLLVRIVDCVSWVHFWVAQARAVLRTPTQMQLCTSTVVLLPRHILGSQHCAPEDYVPRVSHQHQHNVLIGLASYSWFLWSCWDTSALLATALLFPRRNWQQDSMPDSTWVCMRYCGVSPKLIHLPRALSNTIQRNLCKLCRLPAWGPALSWNK